MEKNLNSTISRSYRRGYLGSAAYNDKTNQSQRGQAIIFVVIFLPLLGLLLNYFLHFLILLQQTQKIQKNCRTQAHQAQKILINGFNELEELNPQALALRPRKKIALRAVRAAVEPSTRAAALAYLAFVETQQRLFQAKQKAIILTSKSKAKVEILRITGQKFTTNPPFSLKPKPINSVTPSYYASLNFENEQEIIIPWQIRNTLGLTQEGRCGSYVKKTLTGYIAKISYPDI